MGWSNSGVDLLLLLLLLLFLLLFNLKAQVLWVDLGVSDASLGSKFVIFVSISAILAMSRRKNIRNVMGTIESRGFL